LEKNRTFDVDLENADGLSSSVLAGLISLVKKCRGKDKEVILRNVQPVARNAIDAAKLAKKGGPLTIEDWS